MSFLEQDDDRAALEEALRFIDEFVLPLDDLEAPESSEAPGKTASQPDGATTVHVTKHPKRVRDPAVYARRRMKQKNEMLALRQQVKELERQLAKSLGFSPSRPPPLAFDQTSSPPSTDGDNSTTSESSSSEVPAKKRRAKRRVVSWLAVAMNEQRKRQSSELVNGQLRQALAAQSTVSRALVELVGQHSNSTAVEIERELNRYLLYARVVRMGPPQSVSNANVASDISHQLHATVQRLVLEASSALDGSMVDAVANELCIKHDPVVGTYTETRGVALLGRKLEHVNDYLQHTLWKTKFPPLMGRQVGEKTTTREKHDFVDMALQGSPVRFSGVSVMLKSSETDRLVFTYCTLLFHPSGKLCLREGGWFTIQKSPVNPASECVYRSCSRIAPNVSDGVSVLDGQDIGQVQSFTMAALGEERKLRHQAMQRSLLLATGREDLAGLIPDVDPFDERTAIYRDTRRWPIQRLVPVRDLPEKW